MGRPKGSKNKPKTVVADVLEEVVETEEPVIETIDEDEIVTSIDFRKLYVPRQKIYYLYVNNFDGTKEVQSLTIRTIYTNSIIAFEKDGMSRCIGSKDADMIFDTKQEAENAAKKIKVEGQYTTEDN